MRASDSFYRLQLHDNFFLDNDVYSKSFIKFYTFVFNRHRYLAVGFDISFVQFLA